MQQYAAATLTIDGRTIVVLGDARLGLARAAALAAERVHDTSATVTMAVDTTGAEDFIRLYARANGNGFDRDLFELEESLARRPVMVGPALPLPRRTRTRPRSPRSTPAVRRLSWLVEGRGR